MCSLIAPMTTLSSVAFQGRMPRFGGGEHAALLADYWATYFDDIPQTDPYNIKTSGLTDLMAAVEEVHFDAADGGARLYGWYMPASAPKKPTLLFSPGWSGKFNKGRAFFFEHFRKLGWGVMSYDYRGFERSQGEPSEQGFYHDVLGASQFLEGRGVPRPQQVLLGNSIGAFMTSWLGAQHDDFKAVVLMSPGTNSEEAYQQVALRDMDVPGDDPAIFRGIYDSKARMADIRSPLLILSGAEDEVYPVRMARELDSLAVNIRDGKKQLQVFPGQGHQIDHTQYLPVLEAFVDGLDA